MAENHWGPQPPKTAPIHHSPGGAVGEDSLSGAVGELHSQHPHPVQGEGLQNKSSGKRHQAVGHVYKGA